MGRHSKHDSSLLFPIILLNERNQSMRPAWIIHKFFPVAQGLGMTPCPGRWPQHSDVSHSTWPFPALAALTEKEHWNYPCFAHFVSLWSHSGLKVNTSQTCQIKENMHFSYSFYNRIFSSWLLKSAHSFLFQNKRVDTNLVFKI